MGGYDPQGRRREARKRDWEAEGVRALRRHLGLSQQQMAAELGTRQQTVSEWETGLYRPRGASARLLTIIAEQAGFRYEAGKRREGTGEGQFGADEREAHQWRR
jgi:transcriptional regulator with XRE-family HTH domain